MTPQEKAKELIDKFARFQVYTVGFEVNTHSEFVRMQRSKKSALIAVDEVIAYAKTFGDVTESDVRFYMKVKEEIENL